LQPVAEASLSVDSQRGRLLRVLGVGFGLAVIIGNTIGAGIFRTPGVVAAELPNPWLFFAVWIVGGLYALLGALSVAELGAMIPRSGGQYVFARYALGEYAGFIVGWSDWISTCGTTAAVALVIGDFTGALFPSLAGRSISIAAVVAVVFALLQWRGILWGSRVQNLTSFLKALAFVALVIACFVLGGGGSVTTGASAATVPAMRGMALMTALVLSLQSVIYTYDGWAGAVYFSEEVQNPGRDIPRSMFGGVLLVIGIYFLVNLALLYVLPIERIAGQEFAAGLAAEVIFGAYGDTIFRALTIISMLSCINAYHLMATRVLFAMSRDRLFAKFTARVNAGGTPTAALFLSTIISLLFIVFGETFEQVITVLAFFFVANYTISFISVFVLRRREPDKPRPYRAWGYPWTTALVLLGSIAFLAGAIASDTRNSVYALLLLAASYPAFLLLKWLARKDQGFR
jgi:basic amino acid/polyamine antiporter, APA family